jgi:hypothetical protein
MTPDLSQMRAAVPTGQKGGAAAGPSSPVPPAALPPAAVPQTHWNGMPTTDELRLIWAGMNRQAVIWAAVLGLLTGIAVVVWQINALAVPIPLLFLMLVALPVILWRYPNSGMYLIFGAACLIELFPTTYADALTDKVPFFWNVNTVFQVYLRANVKAIPLNLFEVLLVIIGVMAAIRNVYFRTVKIEFGRLFPFMAVYLVFCGIAFVNGVGTGGDFKIALQEVRGQIYFVLAYLMALNIVRRKQQVTGMLWAAAILIGIKGALYTFRRYVTLHGMPLPDQGVGSHEEAFLFDCFESLLLTLIVTGTHPRLRIVMLILLPLVIMGNLATNRRAGTAAMVVMIPFLMAMSYRALPNRRMLIGALAFLMASVGPVYYQVFKNSDSAIAQPARAIRSQFEPDARDLNSNIYRDAENYNQLATVKLNPVLGYGYGKPFLHAVAMADISASYEWWDLIPHNQILWVWMRTGTFGFLAFWLMISALIIRCCHVVRAKGADRDAKTAAIFAAQTVAMLIVFGLLDLQLVNFRDLLFTGFLVGAVAGMPFRDRPKGEPNDLVLEDAPIYRKRRYIDRRGRYIDHEANIPVEHVRGGRRLWKKGSRR